MRGERKAERTGIAQQAHGPRGRNSRSQVLRVFCVHSASPLRATSLSSGAASATTARRLPRVTRRGPVGKMAPAVGKVR